jgi:hypothetical protein
VVNFGKWVLVLPAGTWGKADALSGARRMRFAELAATALGVQKRSTGLWFDLIGGFFGPTPAVLMLVCRGDLHCSKPVSLAKTILENEPSLILEQGSLGSRESI